MDFTGDEWKTAFEPAMVPSNGLVYAEGLTNAPAAFQRVYEQHFRGY